MDNSLKLKKIIKKGYLTRFMLLLICIFLVGTAVSSAYLYLDLYRPLGTHYSAILSIVTELRETLIVRTLKITVISCLFIISGIAVIGILYTHRIAGPLHRIKLYAKMVKEGRLDTEINFRQKDAIHSFAESLNKMTECYSDRVAILISEIQELKNAVTELKSLAEKGKDTEIAMKKVLDIDSKIEKLLSAVRL